MFVIPFRNFQKLDNQYPLPDLEKNFFAIKLQKSTGLAFNTSFKASRENISKLFCIFEYNNLTDKQNIILM
jgi:hypothetical protein